MDSEATSLNDILNSDPAAEFIAREQKDLIGLDDELDEKLCLTGNSMQDNTDLNLCPSIDEDFESENVDTSNMDFDVSETTFNMSNMNLEDKSEELKSIDFEDRGEGDTEKDNTEVERNKFYVSIKSWFEESVEKKLEESEKIKKWREENKKMIEEKDAKEAKEKEELRLQAKKELDEWYKNYEESLVRSRSESALTDEQYAAGDSGESKTDSEWSRIAELCDLQNKSPHTTKDISRMKEIILELKKNPPERPK